MNSKTKHLRLRITEEQFQRLADALIEEEKTKSALIREALQNYLEDKHQEKKVRTKNKNEKAKTEFIL